MNILIILIKLTKPYNWFFKPSSHKTAFSLQNKDILMNEKLWDQVSCLYTYQSWSKICWLLGSFFFNVYYTHVSIHVYENEYPCVLHDFWKNLITIKRLSLILFMESLLQSILPMFYNGSAVIYNCFFKAGKIHSIKYAELF